MQHAASHTTAVQPSSHNQRHVLIGKQWYQLKYMNNNVENDFSGFPKVKRPHVTGEVDKFVRCSCQMFSGFNVPKLI